MLLRVDFNLSFATTLANTTTLVSPAQSVDVNSIFNMLQQFAGSLGVSLLSAFLALAQSLGVGTLASRTYRAGTIDFGVLTVMALLALLTLLVNYHLQYRS